MSLSLELLGAGVAARLASEMPGYADSHFPDKIPDRRTFAKTKTELLVAYEGSSYGPVQSFEPFSCERTVTISVTLLVRSLRGPLGAQQTIEAIRDALFVDPEIWKCPIGGTPLAPVRDECLGEDQGVWTFVFYFATTTVAVARSATRTGPTFTEASNEYPP